MPPANIPPLTTHPARYNIVPRWEAWRVAPVAPSLLIVQLNNHKLDPPRRHSRGKGRVVRVSVCAELG